MADRILTIESGANTIRIDDINSDKEVEIEVENGYKEHTTVYLDKENLIALREHIDYLLKKLSE